jgi:hypothetical protein
MLKVLTNERRGGLKVVAFDRSPFMLFSLRFSTKSVQAQSCERPKTYQRTLSLSFEIKNWFPIAEPYEKMRETYMPRGNSNTAIDFWSTLQISLEILALFEKIYDGEPIFTVVSNIGEDYNTVVSIKCMM